MFKQLQEFGIATPAEAGEYWIPCPHCVRERKHAEAKSLHAIIGETESSWHCLLCGGRGETTHGTYAMPDIADTRRAYESQAPTLTPSAWDTHAMKRLLRRGLTEATLDRCRVSFERKAWIPLTEEPIDSIALPYYRAGILEAVRYLTSNGYSYLQRERAAGLFGIDDIIYLQESGTIVPQDIAYVVPDEMSKLAMDTAGFPNTIALPFGPPKKDFGRYFDFLDVANYKLSEDDEEGLLDRIETFIVAAGPNEKLQDELVRRLGRDRCCLLRWPKLPLDHEAVTLWDGKKVIQPGDTLRDASEVLYCLGVEAVQEAVRSARPIRIDGIWRVSDFKAELDDYYEHGLPPGVPLPWDAFKDEQGKSCLQAKEQMTWVVTGLPSHGKSRWVENVVVELARAYDWKIGYLSAEVNPKQLHASYILSQWAGLPFDIGYQERMNRELYEMAAKWHDDHFFYYETEGKPFGITDLLERGTKLVRKFGMKCLVIDPWNNVDHFTSRGKFDREDEYIQKTMLEINNWRTLNNAMVIIVAHPKSLETKRDREPVPTLSNIAGGAKFRAMCDVGISVWRDISDETKATRIHVQKVKFHHLGTFGVAEMNFDKATSKFWDVPGVPYNGVRTKETNQGEGPHFDPPEYPTEDGAPPWMQGDEYDV